MKKSILTVGMLAVTLMFSACENEISTNENVENEIGSLKEISFDYVTEVHNISGNIDLQTFELTQPTINAVLVDIDLEGKEIVTVQFIENILEEGDYVKQYGLENFYRKYNLSEFTIQQLLKMDNNEDISSLVNEPQFHNLPQNEKLMLLKAIEINQNILSHLPQNGSNFHAKDGEYTAMYGAIGQLLGTIIAPGAGTAIGWLVGSVVGAIVDESK